LLAEMPELGSVDRRQIASIAGLAPWTRQSGKWKGRSFIGGDRSRLRACLWRHSSHQDTPRSRDTQRPAGRER